MILISAYPRGTSFKKPPRLFDRSFIHHRDIQFSPRIQFFSWISLSHSFCFPHYWKIPSIMWSATLRPSPVRWLRAPGRALSSSFTRGRARPQGPRNSIRRPERVPSARGEGAQSQQQPPQPESSNPETSHPNTANYDPSQNTLLAPVHIPEDPNAVLRENHPAVGLLANSGLVVQRQLELMNVMM